MRLLALGRTRSPLPRSRIDTVAIAPGTVGVFHDIAIVSPVVVIGVACRAHWIREGVCNDRVVLRVATQALADQSEPVITRVIGTVHVTLKRTPRDRAVAGIAFLPAEHKVVGAAPGRGGAVVTLAACAQHLGMVHAQCGCPASRRTVGMTLDAIIGCLRV